MAPNQEEMRRRAAAEIKAAEAEVRRWGNTQASPEAASKLRDAQRRLASLKAKHGM